MPLPRSISLVLAVAAVLSAIAGCSSTDPNRSGFFEPYRIEVPQGNYVDQIMLDRSRFGEAFTKEVQPQLGGWGVEAIKNIELMDIRDTKDSDVIHNIMAKRTSGIERDGQHWRLQR